VSAAVKQLFTLVEQLYYGRNPVSRCQILFKSELSQLLTSDEHFLQEKYWSQNDIEKVFG
jgi:hypothetical protein